MQDFCFHEPLTTVNELMGQKEMTLRYACLAWLHKASTINILDNAITEEKKFSDIVTTDLVGDAGFEPATSAV